MWIIQRGRKEEIKALESQDKIGWRQLLCGKISNQWGKIQENHYKCMGKQKTRRQWSTAVIKIILRQTNEFWMERCTFAHLESCLWATKKRIVGRK